MLMLRHRLQERGPGTWTGVATVHGLDAAAPSVWMATQQPVPSFYSPQRYCTQVEFSCDRQSDADGSRSLRHPVYAAWGTGAGGKAPVAHSHASKEGQGLQRGKYVLACISTGPRGPKHRQEAGGLKLCQHGTQAEVDRGR